MNRLMIFIRSRTYMELIATLHFVVMVVIAWCLLEIASGYLTVEVGGRIGADVDARGIENELSSIESAIKYK